MSTSHRENGKLTVATTVLHSSATVGRDNSAVRAQKHVESMEGEQLTKRAGAFRMDGRRRRGRPRLRREIYVKRDLAGV